MSHGSELSGKMRCYFWRWSCSFLVVYEGGGAVDDMTRQWSREEFSCENATGKQIEIWKSIREEEPLDYPLTN